LLSPGTRLGRYTILDLVAVGGMGEVYRAVDSRLHRDVAIKVLPAELENDASSLDRFHREARAVAALSHPNILSIFDFGSEDDVHYAVTELLEGETLRARLGRGKFSSRDAMAMLLEVAEGVAAAHARGIVHRDLKPENIFITKSERVKVLDFGLARNASGVFARRDNDAMLTEPGIVIGTIGYIAPEQVEARPSTPATDVFALGCMLFEMIEGRVPFDRGVSSAQAMVALLHDEPPHLAEPDVDALLQRMLRKDPAERPHDAGEVASELRALLGGSGRVATVRLAPPKRAGRALVVGFGLLILAALVFAYFAIRNSGVLDDGYDLRAGDIRSDPETRRLIHFALRADAEGNRPKAMQLLEEAGRRNAPTPFPAAFLASFSDAAGNLERGRFWEAEAMKRLEGATPYESLLVRYLATPSSRPDQELALAKSALDLRPNAWRLRLAAAHIYLGSRDREAARRELVRIDIRKPDDRRLMLVLADRASLGDTDGAERDLRRSRLARRPALYHYTLGRIAWSRGEYARAAGYYDRSAQDAANEGIGGIEVEANELAGLAMLRLERFDEAQQRFARTATRAKVIGHVARHFQALVLGAYTAHRLGDQEDRDRKFSEAAKSDLPNGPRAALRLLAIRTQSPVWLTWSTEGFTSEQMSLVRAREAWSAGDREQARRELQRARAEGIDSSELREEAELLAAELGVPSTLLPADPPYPNVLRYLAIFDHPRGRTPPGRAQSPSP
jgi:tetratricopeptide (TPR) repeat protein